MLLAEFEFVPSSLLTQWKHPEAFPSPCWHLAKHQDSGTGLRFQRTHGLQTRRELRHKELYAFGITARTKGQNNPQHKAGQPQTCLRPLRVVYDLLGQFEQPNSTLHLALETRACEEQRRGAENGHFLSTIARESSVLGTFSRCCCVQGTRQSQNLTLKEGPSQKQAN